MDATEWAELQELLLQEQLKVVRRFLKKKKGVPEPTETEKSGKSKISIAKDILESAQTPLHVNEIIERAKNEYQVTIDRESIVSAMTKKIRKGDSFVRVGRNTFGLK